MKNFITLICCTILLSACQTDNEENAKINKLDYSQITTVRIQNGHIVKNTRSTIEKDSGLTLAFKNEQALKNFKQELKYLTNEEKLSIIQSFHINNLHQIAILADKELDSLGNIATTESDFRKLYNNYRLKYSQLLPNNLDTTDLSLYIPDDQNIDTYIGDENGHYVVGQEIRTIHIQNNLSDYTQQNCSAYLANPSYLSENPNIYSVTWSPKKSKRILFRATLKNNNLLIHMSAKKKMWYGWKNDSHREYFFEPYINSKFTYQYRESNGTIRNYKLPRYCFVNNVSNGFDITLGYSSQHAVTGDFYVWTDFTSEHENGKQIMETIDGITVAKCLKEKAKLIHVNLIEQ